MFSMSWHIITDNTNTQTKKIYIILINKLTWHLFFTSFSPLSVTACLQQLTIPQLQHLGIKILIMETGMENVIKKDSKTSRDFFILPRSH